MLDLGVRLAQPAARSVCYVEIDIQNVAVLAARMADGTLEDAPIWTDLKTFDGRPWRGAVDCVVGGYPCQPFSAAGKRRGADDPRHLWPHIARIVSEVQPAYCFFENVAGHLRLGFRAVRSDLQEMGYRVEAGLFTAAEVGAPHLRQRLFVFARQWGSAGRPLEDALRAGPPSSIAREPHELRGAASTRASGDVSLGHPEGERLEEGERVRPTGAPKRPGRFGAPVADANDPRRREHGRPLTTDAEQPAAERAGAFSGLGHSTSGRRQAAGEPVTNEARYPATLGACAESGGDVGHSPGRRRRPGREREAERELSIAFASRESDDLALPVFPPGPADRDAWACIVEQWPDLKPAVRRVADGRAPRTDRLRQLGNGVVPLVAALAWRTLSRALGVQWDD